MSLWSSLFLDTAPQWTAQAVVDGTFEELSLSDYKGKFLVMVWFIFIYIYKTNIWKKNCVLITNIL